MFEALFSKAQKTVEVSVERAAVRALVVLPFLVALAFGAAALSIYLVQAYGSVFGFGAMAAGFVLLGLIVWAFSAIGSTPKAPEQPTEADVVVAPSEGAPQNNVNAPSISDMDRELILAALTSAAPIAVPGLTKMLVRNLPLILTVAGAVFVLSRPAIAAVPEPARASATLNGSQPPNGRSQPLAQHL